MKRVVERHLVLAFWLTICVMAAVRFTVYHVTTATLDTSKRVEHTREVLFELHGGLSALQDAETGTRGFLITGKDNFLEPFNRAVIEEPKIFGRLHALLKDSGSQTLKLLDDAEQLATEKIAHANRTLNLYRTEGFPAAQALVSGGHGKAVMDEFRKKIAALESTENDYLAGNVETARRQRRNGNLAFIAVTLLDFAIIGAAFYFMRRYLRQRDVAEKELVAAAAFQKAILDGANSAIIASVPDGPITIFNQAAEQILGYRAEEVLGKAPPIWHDREEMASRAIELSVELGREVQPGYEVFVAKPTIGQPESREWTWITRTGQRKPVLLSVSAVRSIAGQLLGYCGIAIDISDRRRSEEALRSARDAAEMANKTKSQFLANMSHELRTPLNAIIGYSEMLAEDALSDGQTQTVDDLRKINRAGKQLLSLINDVLDLSKVEAGKMTLHLETFSVPLLVQEAVSMIRSMLNENGNRLSVNLDPSITDMRGDITKLRQVLLNLLSNASKFTRGGDIDLNVETRPGPGPSPASICFTIRDRGIGMTPEQVNNLFRPFTQADSSTSRKFGGTGLGLAISRHFVQLMGGDIVVRSSAGHGSTFEICLPIMARDVVTPERPASLANDSTEPASEFMPSVRHDSSNGAGNADGGTILVIDDDAAVQDLLRRMLEPDGYHVAIAASGDDALTKARELAPVAITLDVIMPGMDGWSVLNALKADSRTAEIPVIMLSILDDKERGYALGATSILNKPVDRTQLMRALEPFRGAPRRSILVVEDDDMTAELLIRTLNSDGWESRRATNGREGLAALQEQRPALVLLDLMMPLMDGFEFAAELRRNPAWRDIPVIVLTAKQLTDEDRQRLNGDVQRILQKTSLSHAEILREVRDTILARASRPANGSTN